MSWLYHLDGGSLEGRSNTSKGKDSVEILCMSSHRHGILIAPIRSRGDETTKERTTPSHKVLIDTGLTPGVNTGQFQARADRKEGRGRLMV